MQILNSDWHNDFEEPPILKLSMRPAMRKGTVWSIDSHMEQNQLLI